MTNQSPFNEYMNILYSAEDEANKGNYELARIKLEEYKSLKKRNDQSFQNEIDEKNLEKYFETIDMV
jgi:hypothetical protein